MNDRTLLLNALEDNREAVMALGDLIVTSMEKSDSTHEHLGAGLNVLFRLIEEQASDALTMARELAADSSSFNDAFGHEVAPANRREARQA
jgi:hypothetical protein